MAPAEDQPFYRFSDMEPEDVFVEGFEPEAPNSFVRLRDWVEAGGLPGPYVSTTRASGLRGGGRYRYRLDAARNAYPAGVDVAATLERARRAGLLPAGWTHPRPGEREVLFIGRVNPEAVVSVYDTERHRTATLDENTGRIVWVDGAFDPEDVAMLSTLLGVDEEGSVDGDGMEVDSEPGDRETTQDPDVSPAVTYSDVSPEATGPSGGGTRQGDGEDWLLGREVLGTREVERTEVLPPPLKSSPDEEIPQRRSAAEGALELRRFQARRYRLPSGEFGTSVVVRIHLERYFWQGSLITDRHLADLSRRAQEGVAERWNTGHRLPNGDLLRLDLEFVTDPDAAHHTVTVRPNAVRENYRTWHVDTEPHVFAHEVGHLLGLEDEYRESDAYGQRVVYLDGPLMGGFEVDSAGRPVVDADHTRGVRSGGTTTMRIPPRHLRQIGAGIEQARNRAEGESASPGVTVPDTEGAGHPARGATDHNGATPATALDAPNRDAASREQAAAGTRAERDRLLLQPAPAPARARFSPDVLQKVLYGGSRPGRGGHLTPGSMSDRPRPRQLAGTERPNGTYRAEYPGNRSADPADTWLPGPGDLSGGRRDPGLMMFPAHWTEEDAVYAAEQAYLHALRTGSVRPARDGGATLVWRGEYAGVLIEGEIVGGVFTGFRPGDDQPDTSAPAYAPPVPLGVPGNGPVFGQRVEDLARYGDRRTLSGAYHAPTVENVLHGLRITRGQANDNGTYRADVRFLDPAVNPYDPSAVGDDDNWRRHRDGDDHVMFPDDWGPAQVLEAVATAHDAARAAGTYRPVDDRGTYHWVGPAVGVRVEGLVRDNRHLAFRPTPTQPRPQWPDSARVGEVIRRAAVTRGGHTFPLDVRYVLFADGRQGTELTVRFHVEASPGIHAADLDAAFHPVRRMSAQYARVWKRSGPQGQPLRLELVRAQTPDEAHHSLSTGPDGLDGLTKAVADVVPGPQELQDLAVRLLRTGSPRADEWRAPAGSDPELGPEHLRRALTEADPFGRPTPLREPDPADRGDWPYRAAEEKADGPSETTAAPSGRGTRDAEERSQRLRHAPSPAGAQGQNIDVPPGAVETGRARIRPKPRMRVAENAQGEEGWEKVPLQWVGGRDTGGDLWVRNFEARRYRLPSGEFASRAVVRVFLEPAEGAPLSQEALAELRQRARQGIADLWNTGHRLPNGDLFGVDLQFVDDEQASHHTVAVHAELPRANHRNWGLDTPSSVLAHEVGHLLGLEDEYRENSDNRRRAVYEDEGLMGPRSRDERGRPLVDNDHLAPGDLVRMRIPPRNLRQFGAWMEAALRTAGRRTEQEVAFFTEDALNPRADGLPARAHFSPEVRRSLLYGEAGTGGGGHVTPPPASDRPRPQALEAAGPNGTYRAVHPHLLRPSEREVVFHPVAGDLQLPTRQERGLMMFPAHWTEEDAVYAAEQAYLDALRESAVQPVPGRSGVHEWAGEYAGVRIEGELSHGVFTGFRPSDDQPDAPAPAYAPPPAPPLRAPSGPVFGRRVEDLVRYGDRRSRTGAHHEPKLSKQNQNTFHGLAVHRGETHHNGTYDAVVSFLHPGLPVGTYREVRSPLWRRHVDEARHVMFPQTWQVEDLLNHVERAHASAHEAHMVRQVDDRGTYHWVGTAEGVRIEGLVRDGRHLTFRPTYVQPHPAWPGSWPVGEVETTSMTVESGERHLPFDVRHVLFANGQRAIELTVRVHLDPAPGTDPVWANRSFDQLREALPTAMLDAAKVSYVNGVPVRLSLVPTGGGAWTHHTLPVVGRDLRKMIDGIKGFLPAREDLNGFVTWLVESQAPLVDAWQPPHGTDPNSGPGILARALDRLALTDPFGRPTTLREPDPTDRGDWLPDITSYAPSAPSAPPADLDMPDDEQTDGSSLPFLPGVVVGGGVPTAPPPDDEVFGLEGDEQPPARGGGPTPTPSFSSTSAGTASDLPADGEVSVPAGGEASEPAGGEASGLAGEEVSGPAGGEASELAGGEASGLAGEEVSGLAGEEVSGPAGGEASELAGGEASELAGGEASGLAGEEVSGPEGEEVSGPAGGETSGPVDGEASEPAGGEASGLAGGEVSGPEGGEASELADGEASGPAGEEEPPSAGDINGRPAPAGPDAAAPRQRTQGPSRIEAQLDTHRPPRLDRTMPAPTAEDGPVVFTDGSRLPEYLTTGNGTGDAQGRSYGHSRVTLRGADLVVAEIARGLDGRHAGPGLDEALDAVRRALGTTPHLFAGDGFESPSFGEGARWVLRVVTRPHGNWERFADVHATPVKIDAAHRSQVGDSRGGVGGARTRGGVGVMAGPPSGWAGFGRIAVSGGVGRSHEHTLQSQTLSQVESRAAEGSHLHLDDVRYEVAVVDADGLAREPGDRLDFSVRNGLTVRLADSATSPAEPGRVPRRMTLDARADYRLVHTEGFGPLRPLRDRLVREAGVVPGSEAHAYLSAFFGAEYFQRAADRLARGGIATDVLFDEDGAPLGAFVVERIVPGEAVLLTESQVVEMRNTLQQTARNERTFRRASSLGVEVTAGPSAGLGLFGKVTAGVVVGREHTVTDDSVFGGSGARKVVGRAKNVPTVLYQVRKTVQVRRSGSEEVVSFETWSLDRMTHTEARRLAGWDDGTTLRARHGNEPLPPPYLTDDRPALLGMSRPEAFGWADGRAPADTSQGWLETFTDRVVRAAAERYPGVLAPLEAFSDPADARWRDRDHFVMALENTLRVRNALSHHSVAGNLEVITTTGLSIALDVPPALTTRSQLTLRIDGELTRRRYEGTQNDLILRASAPGTERLDGSSATNRTLSWGGEVRAGVTDRAAASGRMTWGRSRGRGTQYGGSVSFEPLAASARPSHLYSYRLSLTVATEGFARYRAVPRALSLGILGARPQESRDLIGGAAGTPFTGSVVLAVPDEHTTPAPAPAPTPAPALEPVAENGAEDDRTADEPAAEEQRTEDDPTADDRTVDEPAAEEQRTEDDPTADDRTPEEPTPDDSAAQPYAAEALEPARARALVAGTPSPDEADEADGSRPWDVFRGHAQQAVSVGSPLVLARAAQDLMAGLSGGAWHFTRTGAVPHDAMVRLFQSQALTSGFDQASGPVGSRSVFFAEGLLRHRVGELVHQVRVQGLRVVSRPVKMGTELAIGSDLIVGGSVSAGSSFSWALTAGVRDSSRPGGTELVSTYGLRYGRGGLRSETVAVVRTVTWDANADDGRHHVLVAGDTRHDLAGSVRVEGLLRPVLAPFRPGGPQGVRLTLPDSYLGHLGEKSAHRLGLLRDGLGEVPLYTSPTWAMSPWWQGYSFGSYPVNTLDAAPVLADFDRQLRALRASEADRERVRSLVTPRALRALREQMTAGGTTGRTRIGRWTLGVPLGRRVVGLRVELVAGESRFDGLDHSVTVEDTRTANTTQTRGRSTGRSRAVGTVVSQSAVTTAAPQGPQPGDLLSVPTTFDGAVVASGQTARSLSRTLTRTQRFYPREPHAQYLTGYRLRLTLVGEEGAGAMALAEDAVGTLREYVPLCMTAPAHGAVPTDDPLGPPTVTPPPRTVTLWTPGAVDAEVEEWRSTELPDGTRGPFRAPAVGWMVRRVVGLDTLRQAATLAMSEAYGNPVTPAADRRQALAGEELGRAAERAAGTRLTRPGTASAVALDNATRDAALASFFDESGTAEGYTVPGLTDTRGTHGDLRLYSRPDLDGATLLAVVPESTMEVAERDSEGPGRVRSRASGYDSAFGVAPLVAADTVGSAAPAANITGPNVSGADRWTAGAVHGAQLTEKPAGRSFVFAVPTSWLGVAEVERSRQLFGRVRRVRAVETQTQLITVVHEDTARELGLIGETNFPARVADAWDQVTRASKAWIAADEAYWKKRRTLADQPDAAPEQDGDDSVAELKLRLLRPLLDESEAAAAEYHRVRAAADRLTRWHQLPAGTSGPGEPEQREGLAEPPPVVYEAPRPTGPAPAPAPRYTQPDGIPDQLVSPEGVLYTVHDVPADGDAFFHALAEGVHHATPERTVDWTAAADRQEIVRDLRTRLAGELDDPRNADLLDFTSPDTRDGFDDSELAASGVTFDQDSPERREFEATGRMPLHAELPTAQRAALARAQLLRSGDAEQDAGWDHGAADLLAALASRHFGARITVVGADGAFQDFTPPPSDAREALPHVVLHLENRHFRAALPAAEPPRTPALPAPSPAPATAPGTGGTPAARPPRPAHDSMPWTAGSGGWRASFAPGRAPTLTGPDGTAHTLVEPVGDGNGFWSAVAGGLPGPDGDQGAPAGDGVWDEATERDAVGHAAGVLGVGVTVVDEDGTVRLPADGGRAYGRPVILYRRAGEYLLARPDLDPAEGSAVRPDDGADDANGVEGVRDPADVVPGDRTPDRTAHDRPEDAGAVVTPQAAEERYGMPVKNFDKFRRFASEHGLVIDVRPTNPEAPRWLARGALPKPKEIKAKTINALDVLLGAHPDHVGLVGYFEPTAPERTSDMDDELWDRLQGRYEQRSRESEDLAPTMARLAAEGTFTVRDGVVQGRDDAGADRPITGDHDIFDISTPGGSKLTPRSYDQLIGDMRANDMGVMHGAHLYWAAPRSPFSESVFKKILESHRHGGEPLLRFGPGDVNTRLAWSDPPRISLTANEAPPVVDSTEADRAEEGLAEQGRVEEGRAEETLAEQGRVDQGPAEVSLVEEGLVDQGPAEESRADQGPAEESLAEQGPAEESLAEQGPVEESLAEQGPVEESLAEQGPVEQSRAEESRADQGPAEESLAEQSRADQGPAEESPAEQGPSGPEFDVELRALLDSADLLATPVGPHDVAGLTYAPQAAAFWALTQEPQRLADLRLAPADVEDLLRRNPALFTPAIQAAFTRLTAHRKAKETGPGPDPDLA
ncbi:EndoU domain-containing protein [Streptomyces griseoruber]